MNLYLQIFEELPQKTPESKADSAYLSPSSDYFWWFDGWSMQSIQSSPQGWCGCPNLPKKNPAKMWNKKPVPKEKNNSDSVATKDPVLLSLQFPTPLISGAWNSVEFKVGHACGKTIKNQVSLVQMQPHHPVISWPCDIVVSWLPFPCLPLDSRRLFGISVSDVYIFMFFEYIFLPPASSCMAQCVNDVPLRWPGCPSGSLVRWLAPQSQVLRGRRKVLENVIVQSYQIYANMVEKLNRSNQKLAHRAGLWIFFDTCHISSI